MSRELGSALGIAILGTVINGLYRDNVEDRLAGTVPTEVVEAAGEGIGVAAATAADLPDDLAAKVMTGASDGLVAAMNTGFWASVAITVASIVVAMAMLTDRSRST